MGLPVRVKALCYSESVTPGWEGKGRGGNLPYLSTSVRQVLSWVGRDQGQKMQSELVERNNSDVSQAMCKFRLHI